MYPRLWIIITAALVLSTPPATAQRPGERVRIDGETVGEVTSADSAGMRLASGFHPFASMESLEVRVGSKGQFGRGFKYGFLAGAGVGVILALTTDEACWWECSEADASFNVLGL